MKIQLVSDLHLEFEHTYRPTNARSDLLILSGDILVAEYFKRNVNSPYYSVANHFRNFLQHCSQNWKDVIYVIGNHEHYHGRFEDTLKIIRKEVAPYRNIHLLEKQSIVIDNIKFIGTCLWTDVNKDCPITYSTINSGMNDYKIITRHRQGAYRKLNPYDTFMEHRDSLSFIDKESAGEENVVVCTHHAPSRLSVTPRFKDQIYMNGGFCSELFDFIEARPQIKMWTHGHVHSSNDYSIGGTRIICNPRGYNGENPDFDDQRIFEC